MTLKRVLFKHIVALFKKYNISFDHSNWEVEPVFIAAGFRYTSLREATNLIKEPNKSKIAVQNSVEYMRFPFLVKNQVSKSLIPEFFVQKAEIIKRYLRFVPNGEEEAHDLRVYYGFKKKSGVRGFGEPKKKFIFSFNLMIGHLEKAGEDPSSALVHLVCDVASKLSSYDQNKNAGVWDKDLIASILAEQNPKKKQKAYKELLSSVSEKLVFKANYFSSKLAQSFIRYYDCVMSEFKLSHPSLESEILETLSCMRSNEKLLSLQLEGILQAAKGVKLTRVRGHRAFFIMLDSEFSQGRNYYCSFFPMFVRPEDWSLVSCERNGSYYFDIQKGGFLNNQSNFFKAVHSKKAETYLNFTEEVCKNVNALQSVGFSANPYAYLFFTKNFQSAFINYCICRKVDYNDFVKSSAGSGVVFYTFFEYLSEKNIIDTDPCRFEEVITSYQRFQLALLDYIFLVEFSGSLLPYIHDERGDVFYFPVFKDGRGRIYYGSTFSPQGCPLTKCLLRFSGSKGGSIDLGAISSSKLGKKYFEEIRDLLNPWDAFYDASCSGVSIIGGLIGSRDCMLSTNIVVKSSNLSSKSKQDFYSAVLHSIDLNVFQFYLGNSDSRRTDGVHLYARYQKSGLKDFCLFDDGEDDDFIDETISLKKDLNFTIIEIDVLMQLFYLILHEIFNRDFVKGWTMRYVYSEGPRSRCKVLMLEYTKYRFQFFEHLKTIIKFDIPVAVTTFERYLAFNFCEMFPIYIEPEVAQFMTFLQDLFSTRLKASDLLICTDSKLAKPSGFFASLDYRYEREEYISFFHRSETGNLVEAERQSFVVTDSLDSSKLRHSLIANFIHHLDSRLLNEVVRDLTALGIPCAVVHDCFMVPIKHKEILQQFYFEAYKRILLEKDVVRGFLNANAIRIDFASERVLKEYENNRVSILKSLSDKSLIRSDFILS